ncbi:hypothetical protein BASA81_009118 [Batrachochytrium salamandrivorans]|nr:hypothetical protein BASA81_009118 [Batrachochytrium salamandrivorans]
MGKITVVVLGDVGRSPRMQYHSLSLCQLGAVRLVGLRGEPCIPEVEANCQICALEDVELFRRLPYLLGAPLRALSLSLKLLGTLLSEDTDLFLVQNPPAIPTLVVVCVAAWLSGAAIVVDWHNLGFKMFPQETSGFARLTKQVERVVGSRMADLNLTVTVALKQWLQQEFILQPNTVCVLHDRPFGRFSALTSSFQQERFEDILQLVGVSYQDAFVNRTVLLAVTSTSWTEDEDFDMLLEACLAYKGKRKLYLVITGKGPLLAKYKPALARFPNSHCQLQSVWFSQQDYPKFLQVCQLGISMHTSTSGLDLPMKVIDMFGSGLPVLAKQFDCVQELVRPGENGILFSSATELAELLNKAGNGSLALDEMQQHVKQHPLVGWQEHWNATVKHEFETLLLLTEARRTRTSWWWLVAVLLVAWGLELV